MTNMAIQTPEYCSLQYLNQWIEYDKPIYKALCEGSEVDKLDQLNRAGNFYKVARNLPGKYNPKDPPNLNKYKKLLDLLEDIEKDQFKDDPVSKIINYEKEIRNQYKSKKKVLSLTTKFLWFKVRHPILIYDSRARAALKTEDDNYESFYKAWRKEFKNKQDDIEEACKQLPGLSSYSYSVKQKNYKKELINHIENVCSKKWFHERVFDIYLWNKGNNS